MHFSEVQSSSVYVNSSKDLKLNLHKTIEETVSTSVSEGRGGEVKLVTKVRCLDRVVLRSALPIQYIANSIHSLTSG